MISVNHRFVISVNRKAKASVRAVVFGSVISDNRVRMARQNEAGGGSEKHGARVKQRPLRLLQEEMDKVDDYFFQYRFPSRNAAARYLIRFALKQKPKPTQADLEDNL